MVYREKSLLILNLINTLSGQNSERLTSKEMCFKGQSVYTIYKKKKLSVFSSEWRYEYFRGIHTFTLTFNVLKLWKKIRMT
jgi:hypothetical protein